MDLAILIYVFMTIFYVSVILAIHLILIKDIKKRIEIHSNDEEKISKYNESINLLEATSAFMISCFIIGTISFFIII